MANVCTCAVIHLGKDSDKYIKEFQEAYAQQATAALGKYSLNELKTVKESLNMPIDTIDENRDVAV